MCVYEPVCAVVFPHGGKHHKVNPDASVDWGTYDSFVCVHVCFYPVHTVHRNSSYIHRECFPHTAPELSVTIQLLLTHVPVTEKTHL